MNHLRNKHHINVTGDHLPRLIENFAELRTDFNVSQRMIENIVECGYTSPTPIQMQAIPAMLKVRSFNFLIASVNYHFLKYVFLLG